MMSNWMTRLARRSISSPAVYGSLRTAMLVLQWLTRRPDEPDLEFLARLPARENELILDIGANGGQSAVALSFIRPQARILSYEPIATLWPELERVRMILGDRFDFRKYALGEKRGRFTLYIPVSGRLPITTRASTSEKAAIKNCDELESAVGLPTKVEHLLVEVRQGDTEELRPSAIKIDVEGAEYKVIQGLQQTIMESRPVVILEKSDSFEDCARFFRAIEYEILTCREHFPNEMHLPGLSSRNWLACPREMTPLLRAGRRPGILRKAAL